LFFFLSECEANDSNKLEKALVDILSDIQTPQLHQQVNIFNNAFAFQHHAIFEVKKDNSQCIFHLHQLQYSNYNNSQQILKEANKIDLDLQFSNHSSRT